MCRYGVGLECGCGTDTTGEITAVTPPLSNVEGYDFITITGMFDLFLIFVCISLFWMCFCRQRFQTNDSAYVFIWSRRLFIDYDYYNYNFCFWKKIYLWNFCILNNKRWNNCWIFVTNASSLFDSTSNIRSKLHLFINVCLKKKFQHWILF